MGIRLKKSYFRGFAKSIMQHRVIGNFSSSKFYYKIKERSWLKITFFA